MVISVGIDVSKDKHDCFIQSSEGEVLVDVFTFSLWRNPGSHIAQRLERNYLNSQQGSVKTSALLYLF